MFGLSKDEKLEFKSRYIQTHDCVYLKKEDEKLYCALEKPIEINNKICFQCECYSNLPFDKWWFNTGKHLFDEKLKKDMKIVWDASRRTFNFNKE